LVNHLDVVALAERREMDAGDRRDEVDQVAASIARGVANDDPDSHRMETSALHSALQS
jgi:hypothetical protein